jgi:hypothetical protein
LGTEVDSHGLVSPGRAMPAARWTRRSSCASPPTSAAPAGRHRPVRRPGPSPPELPRTRRPAGFLPASRPNPPWPTHTSALAPSRPRAEARVGVGIPTAGRHAVGPIDEQTILVTGATDGLGRALARELALQRPRSCCTAAAGSDARRPGANSARRPATAASGADRTSPLRAWSVSLPATRSTGVSKSVDLRSCLVCSEQQGSPGTKAGHVPT